MFLRKKKKSSTCPNYKYYKTFLRIINIPGLHPKERDYYRNMMHRTEAAIDWSRVAADLRPESYRKEELENKWEDWADDKRERRKAG